LPDSDFSLGPHVIDLTAHLAGAAEMPRCTKIRHRGIATEHRDDDDDDDDDDERISFIVA